MVLELLKREPGLAQLVIEGRAVWLKFVDEAGVRYVNVTGLFSEGAEVFK